MAPRLTRRAVPPTATLNFTYSGTNLNLFDTGGVRTLTLTGTNTGPNTFGLQVTNQGTNVSNILKNGPGSWILSGAHTYTGSTIVNGGALTITNSLAYGVGTLTVANVAGNGVLNVPAGCYNFERECIGQ